MPPITFKSFEFQEREHSPNAVLGITEDGKRLFITAPASSLGKQLGDQMAIEIRKALERAYIYPKLTSNALDLPEK